MCHDDLCRFQRYQQVTCAFCSQLKPHFRQQHEERDGLVLVLEGPLPHFIIYYDYEYAGIGKEVRVVDGGVVIVSTIIPQSAMFDPKIADQPKPRQPEQFGPTPLLVLAF